MEVSLSCVYQRGIKDKFLIVISTRLIYVRCNIITKVKMKYLTGSIHW